MKIIFLWVLNFINFIIEIYAFSHMTQNSRIHVNFSLSVVKAAEMSYRTSNFGLISYWEKAFFALR